MIAPAIETVEHVVLYDVSWEAYERILEAFGDRRLRHSYSNGVLEIMSPLKRHDRAKKILARLVEMMALEFNIEIQSIGSTTLRQEPKSKGLEPDECYYIAHELEVRGKPDYDPLLDPPPDLAIEVDVTNSSVSRMEIYGNIRVPEIWRMAGEKVSFFRLLNNDEYEAIPTSTAFPFLTPLMLERALAKRFELGENQLIRDFITEVRAVVNKDS